MNTEPAPAKSPLARLGTGLGSGAVVVYMAIGFIQFLAAVKGVAIMFQLPSVVGGIICFVIAWIPVIGTIAGIKGAMLGWGWKLWPAVVLFCGPYVLYLLAIACGGVADLWAKHVRSQTFR